MVTRALLILLAVASFILGAGAPGLGWALSVLTLVATSIWIRRMGRASLIAVIALVLVQLFAWGPLSGSVWRQSAEEWRAALEMAMIPVLAAIFAVWRARRCW